MSHSVESHLRLDCKDYDHLIRTFLPGYETMLDRVAEILRCLFPNQIHVLDLGTGTGALAYTILKKIPYATVEVWDVDKSMLALARERLQPFSVRVEYVERTFLAPLPDCDAVVACCSLHHVKERNTKDRLFQNIHSALKQGGIFLNADITVPTAQSVFDLTQRDWIQFQQQKGWTEKEAQQHLLDWAEEDKYFSIYEELASLAEAGFANPECFWRLTPSTIYGGVKTGLSER